MLTEKQVKCLLLLFAYCILFNPFNNTKEGSITSPILQMKKPRLDEVKCNRDSNLENWAQFLSCCQLILLITVTVFIHPEISSVPGSLL